MVIIVGDRLPQASFWVMSPEGPELKSTDEIFAGRKIALFAVPGAYTRTCHNQHVPNFLQNLDALMARGIDEVICIAVNDIFVLDSWSKVTGAEGKILFLSDGNCEFTQAIGLEVDRTASGFGIRSKRYSMLVDNGVVEVLNFDEVPGEFSNTSAETLLESLQ